MRTEDTVKFKEILDELSKPLEKGLIKKRPGWRDNNGNWVMVGYIEWFTAADLLDKYAVDWSHSIKEINVSPNGTAVFVVVTITIFGVSREGVGASSNDSLSIDALIKAAEHDALKRAAVKFGIGRELYKDEEPVPVSQQKQQQSPSNNQPAQQASNKGKVQEVKPPSVPKTKFGNDNGEPGERTLLNKQFNAISSLAKTQKTTIEKLMDYYGSKGGYTYETITVEQAGPLITELNKYNDEVQRERDQFGS